MPLRQLREDCDIRNLPTELTLAKEDVQTYLGVRAQLMSAAEKFPNYCIDTLAKMVFDACGVTEEFMDFYAKEHEQYISDSIINKNSVQLKDQVIKELKAPRPPKPPEQNQ